MQKAIKSFWIILLTAVLLFSALPVISSADNTHTLNISFSETDDGKTLASLILSEADRLTAIEFSIILTSDTAIIEDLSTEGTDLSDKIFDFDNIPEDSTDGEIFTYTTTEETDAIRFSGFFLEALTRENNFHLCDITFSSDAEFTEEDIFVFSYTLTCEDWIENRSYTYSLKNQDIADGHRAYLLGDADIDGKVDATDARLILRASVGLDTLTLKASPYADSDYDGKFTATDARFSLRLSVGLEQEVMHSFIITLQDDKYCEEGGNYTFTCRITGKIFSMEIEKGGHIFNEAAVCLNPLKCEICGEELSEAAGHNFDENGICSLCSADKTSLDEAKASLINLLDEINMYDILADEAISLNNKTEFLNYTQEATKSIKKAADACDGTADLTAVEEHLMTAYNIRFQAFISVMDENGDILANTENCNLIRDAINQSKEHIDYASYLYE